ncbi:hypothetical protein UFOVP116_240 [uncultured Caudovirales phage]|uniref:Uncharacterized protein n=1 Tax=uncultured Caudovirales phage TaxID=2100421 RepID=A0A6J5L6L8_9CAUD|nr:hypothetical protein UFOVP116_240 [uncultured Caudovirales phage]
MHVEIFITICLVVLLVLTVFIAKIASYIIDYKQVTKDFEQQQFDLEDLEDMDL